MKFFVFIILLISFNSYSQYLEGVDVSIENYDTIMNHQINSGDVVDSSVLNKKVKVLNLKMRGSGFLNFIADWTKEPIVDDPNATVTPLIVTNEQGGVRKNSQGGWIEVAAQVKIPEDGSVTCSTTIAPRNTLLGMSKVRSINGQLFQTEHAFFLGGNNIDVRYQNDNNYSTPESNYGPSYTVTIERRGATINYYIDGSLVYNESERFDSNDPNRQLGGAMYVVVAMLYGGESGFDSCSIKVYTN